MGLVNSEQRAVAAWSGIRICYAIDVDGEVVTIWRAQRTGKSLRGRRVFSGEPSAGDPDWLSALQSMRTEVETGGAWVVGVLPAHSALVKTVDAPFASKAKAASVFPSLLDIRLPFPLEQCQYAFPESHALPDGQVRALAVAARFEDIDQYKLRWQEWQIEPALLDHEGLLLWSIKSPVRGLRVVAWIGRQRTCIAIGVDSKLEQVYALRIGAQTVEDKGLGELSRRIQRIWKSLPTPWSEQPVTWTLSGEISPNFAEELENELSEFSKATVQWEEPFLLNQLARRALLPGPLSCNFLANEHGSAPLRDRLARRNRRTAIFFAACGLLLCGLAFGWSHWLKTQQQILQQQIDATFLALTGQPNVQRGMEPVIARRVLDGREKDAQPFTEMFAPSRVVVVEKVLQYCATQGIRLEKLTLGPNEFLCAGRAESGDELNALQQLIEQQNYVVDLVRNPSAGEVAFTLNGKVRL